MPAREFSDLLEKLRSQVGFIKRSCTAFDDGHEDEGERLALAARILVHDTPQSHSLLGQLGVKTAVRFTDTSIDEDDPVIHNGQVIHGAIVLHAGLVIIKAQLGASPSSRFAALLAPDNDSARTRPPVPFQRWWERPFLKDDVGVSITRSKLTRDVANKDGGAHIAPTVSESYRRLSAGTGVPLQPAGDGSELAHQFAMATMRQIAWELLDTFEREIPHFLGDDAASPWTAVEAVAVPRNALCPCGSGRKFKTCHGG
jgi:hypothetical protein